MNLIGAAITLATIAVVLFAKSRRVALFSLIAGTIYVTQGQALSIGGLNIFSERFFEIAGVIRVFARHEINLKPLNSVDKALLTLFGFTVVVYCLRANDGFANEIGVCIDWTLAYFICRCLLQGIEDLRWLLRYLIILLVPYVIAVFAERHFGQSLWYSMGGVSSSEGWTRSGALRCTGSFRHPSLMGSLGGSFLALYIAMICSRTNRRIGYIGAVLCLLLVLASNSGGPLNFAAVCVLGWIAWRARVKVKWIFRGLLGLVVILALIMKAPVWFLLQRISDITGGDGWHRAELIDQAVRHIGLWWFAGMDLSKTVGWFEYVLPNIDSADICNQFVLFGLQAGIGAVILFIVLLAIVFKKLGLAMDLSRSRTGNPQYTEFYLWGLGVLLVGHISNWLGITYFDQFYMIWSLQLSAMVTLADEAIRNAGDPITGDLDATPTGVVSEKGSAREPLGVVVDVRSICVYE